MDYQPGGRKKYSAFIGWVLGWDASIDFLFKAIFRAHTSFPFFGPYLLKANRVYTSRTECITSLFIFVKKLTRRNWHVDVCLFASSISARQTQVFLSLSHPLLLLFFLHQPFRFSSSPPCRREGGGKEVFFFYFDYYFHVQMGEA